jgi:ubiquitin fusion degradation protein 1
MNIFQNYLANGQMMYNRTTFDEQYHCYSMAVCGRSNLDDGDKILLPPSALDILARMSVAYPMLFELTNTTVGKRTHGGVLEFTADEGCCYLPFWMMQGLFLEEGALLSVRNVTLPKAQFVKFQAQNVNFLKITNPRAVLEVALRKFTCLTKGDMICLPYAGTKYYLEVTDAKPSDAVSIVENDVQVDFDEPVGYQESEYGQAERLNREKKLAEEQARLLEASKPRPLQQALAPVENVNQPKFVPFSGAPQRIDGRKVSSSTPPVGESNSSNQSMKESTSGRTLLDSASPSPPIPSSSSSAPPAVNPYKPTIGNKYSKTKVAVSAFNGTGHKLT